MRQSRLHNPDETRQLASWLLHSVDVHPAPLELNNRELRAVHMRRVKAFSSILILKTGDSLVFVRSLRVMFLPKQHSAQYDYSARNDALPPDPCLVPVLIQDLIEVLLIYEELRLYQNQHHAQRKRQF